MPFSSFRLDHAGIRQILKSSEVADAINGLADQVAAEVPRFYGPAAKAQAMPVSVDHYTTDRRAASIALASLGGRNEEAVNAPLTKAAAAVGLEVRSK